MEEQSVKQAFGSPGGKTKLSSKIVAMLPEHRIYVEPFAGGAAVYFKKGASEKEVLNDKDAEIAFAFRFLRDMTAEQFERLKKMNWRVSEAAFKRVKGMKPKDNVERFYRFYYLKKASFGYGNVAYNQHKDGAIIGVNHLERIKERLSNTRVHNKSALQLIDKYDSPSTLFYLDPPYPDRAFIGATFGKYTMDDLMALIKRLKTIKGKFLLSLSTEHLKYMPSSWRTRRVKLRRSIPRGDEEWNKSFQYEIVVANYPLDGQRQLQADRLRLIPRKVKIKKRKPYRPPTISLAGMRG